MRQAARTQATAARAFAVGNVYLLPAEPSGAKGRRSGAHDGRVGVTAGVEVTRSFQVETTSGSPT